MNHDLSNEKIEIPLLDIYYSKSESQCTLSALNLLDICYSKSESQCILFALTHYVLP